MQVEKTSIYAQLKPVHDTVKIYLNGKEES